MLYNIYKTKSFNLVISFIEAYKEIIYKIALILRKHDFIQAALLKRPAKTPCESVLYKKWPRNPPCQNALRKCPLQKVASKPALLKRPTKVSSIKSGLKTRPAKTPYQNALQKCPL
jgi:hypothetical protein